MELATYFSIKGYSVELVSTSFLKVNSLTRLDILGETLTPEKDSKKLFLILDYNPSLTPIKEWLHELWQILCKSSAPRILVDVKLIIGYIENSPIRG